VQRKCCYMGHRRWLPMDHRSRMNKIDFDGTQELDGPHVMPNGEHILRQLEVFEFQDHDVGREKRQMIAQDRHGTNVEVGWKKKSIVTPRELINW
jgi:hypothetical protein